MTQTLREEIAERVRNPRGWTIGVTSDPNPHRREHPSRGSWRVWMAESEEAARRIEQHFLAQGLEEDREPKGASPVYVFIF